MLYQPCRKGKYKMAEKRMFAKQTVTSDRFLDLPVKAKVLYFYLSLYADDEGFISCAKNIQRMTGCKPSDLNALCDSGYLIAFDSGVYVITHWKVSNSIRADRLKKTSFEKERAMLYVRADGMYLLDPEKAASQRNNGKEKTASKSTDCCHLPDTCQSDDGADKVSTEKNSADKASADEISDRDKSTGLSGNADKEALTAAAYRNSLIENFGTENVERYEERFNKWADKHDRQGMPMYPTIEKWMNEDNISKSNANSASQQFEEYLMLDYI